MVVFFSCSFKFLKLCMLFYVFAVDTVDTVNNQVLLNSFFFLSYFEALGDTVLFLLAFFKSFKSLKFSRYIFSR